MSSPNYKYTFLPQVFHYGETTTNEALLQIQRRTIHTANLTRALSYFQDSVVAFTEEEEEAERAAIFRHTIRAFRRDTHAGEGTPNILDSPPQPVQGLVLVDGHATEQRVVQGAVLLDEGFMPVDTPSSPTAVSDTEPLFITNPDILLPLRPSTPYPVYPGPLPPTYDKDKENRGNYQPRSPTPEEGPQPGLIPGDKWIRNLQGLEPLVNHHIPGMAGREIIAPFFHYDFTPDYPEIILSCRCNCANYSRPLRAQLDPYPHQVLT